MAHDAAIEEVDLIVVGAGAGGMTAALTAALQGLKVVLCEASRHVGGTTATSAGTLWVPGNLHALRAGLGDSGQCASAYLDAVVGTDDIRNMRRSFLETAPFAIDYLERNSAVAFTLPRRHPDYLDLPNASDGGRALSPVEFDGRLLGRDFVRIRPPLPDFLVLGGMMVSKDDIQTLVNRYSTLRNFRKAAQLLLRYGVDRLRYPRGTRLVMGNALVARLFYSLRQLGVPIRFGARLQRLKQHDGRINEAHFDIGGEISCMRARAGIVMATGGIGHSERLRATLLPDDKDLRCLAAKEVRGDGIEAALQVDAEMERHAPDFFYQPVSIVPSRQGEERLFPHIFLDRAKPGLIAVNSAGARFVNEGASYHHFVEGMINTGGPIWLVCDADFIHRYGLGVIPPGTRNFRAWEREGYVVFADTIAGLAGSTGINPAGLKASVMKNNQYAKVGQDPDYGKGSTQVSRFNGDPTNDFNPCLGPIASTPFCALRILPADAASSTGLATNNDGIVLDTRGSPLNGLYACGNDMASVMRGAYPGPGTTLGPAMVFGYRIGMHAKAMLMGCEGA